MPQAPRRVLIAVLQQAWQFMLDLKLDRDVPERHRDRAETIEREAAAVLYPDGREWVGRGRK